jgi:hypothetical protein
MSKPISEELVDSVIKEQRHQTFNLLEQLANYERPVFRGVVPNPGQKNLTKILENMGENPADYDIDEIDKKIQERERAAKLEAYNNQPLLPFSNDDYSYTVNSGIHYYGGTIKNPEYKEQQFVEVTINDPRYDAQSITFLNLQELDDFIAELQKAREIFQ